MKNMNKRAVTKVTEEERRPQRKNARAFRRGHDRFAKLYSMMAFFKVHTFVGRNSGQTLGFTGRKFRERWKF